MIEIVLKFLNPEGRSMLDKKYEFIIAVPTGEN